MVFSLLGNSKPTTPGTKLSIELDGVDQDGIIFLRGDRDRAASVFISGRLKLTVTKPLEVRNIHIRLLGKIRLNVPLNDKVEKSQDISEHECITLESYFYQRCWDKIITPGLENSAGPENVNSSCIRETGSERSSNSFKGLFSVVKGFGSNSNKANAIFDVGEHTFAFSAILPGDLPETIHNHPNVFVAYQLIATIQQSKGLPDLKCTQQLMFIRNISIDMLDFQNSEYTQTHWNQRIAIHMELPWKMAALGSNIDICCLIRSKGTKFKIKEIIIDLAEYGIYEHDKRLATRRRKISQQTTSDPFFTSSTHVDGGKTRIEWLKKFSFPIPGSLGEVTQDCSILNKIKVAHLLEITLSILLPSGEIHSVNLELPIYLYISSFIPLQLVKRNYFNETTLYFRQPPIETGEPLLPDHTILGKRSIYADNNNQINEDIIMKDLFPSSYEDHIHDAKIEMYENSNLSEVDFLNNKNIVKINSQKDDRVGKMFDVRYPPPIYTTPEDISDNSETSTISAQSIDLVDMLGFDSQKFELDNECTLVTTTSIEE